MSLENTVENLERKDTKYLCLEDIRCVCYLDFYLTRATLIFNEVL